MSTNNTIPFNFTYYAMKLLGKNLYSSPWTAISEIVANGIDAGANNVYVYVDMSNKEHATVEIFDDGQGMSYHDLCNKYTLIGRNRRDTDNVKGKTLGRKGIGKLAALYLSPKYIISTKTVDSYTTWKVDTKKFHDSDIPTLDRIENQIYFATKEQWDKIKTGTMIHLADVDLRKIGEEKIKKLSAILADYYLSSIVKTVIHVCVSENSANPICFEQIHKSINYETMYSLFDNRKEKALLKPKVYLTSKDDLDIINYPRPTVMLDENKYNCIGTVKVTDLNGEEKDVKYELVGWLGIHVSLKKDILLRNVDDEKKYVNRPNSIRLYVRGKLAVENLMNYIGSNQALANYIEGELSFDILDDDDFEDSSTSSREGYTLTDPRVKKLIEIASKICSTLLQERSKIGTQINQEKETYLNQLYEEQRKQKEAEERLRIIAQKEKDITQKKLEKSEFDLGSEKRRSSFLKDSLSEDQITYSKRLHMVKINNSTIKTIIRGLVEQHKRNVLTLESAWNGIQDISYCNERIKAVLEYYAAAEFDPKDEKVQGDLFEFISEYCKKITQKVCEAEEHEIVIRAKINGSFHCSFVPQDIGVIIDNIVSNSYKNRASEILFNMYVDENGCHIDASDNGDGLSPKANINELFEFGKSYSNFGTGIGLYHIKKIVDDMNGIVYVNEDYKQGFEIKMRF